MEAITEPHVECENPQDEEVEEQKVIVRDGRGRSPASLANLKPRGKKAPDEPKVKYSTVKKSQDTNIYDFATPPEEPKGKKVAPPPAKPKKRRTRVVVVEDDSDDESEDDIQVVVAKKQKPKTKPPRPSTPKRPVDEPVESDDDELERKPPKPILKAAPKPTINFF